MASRRNVRIGIQIVLGIIIVILAYVLYESITGPYAEIARQEELTERTRSRMDNIRQALIRYEEEYDRFPGTLDSLVMYLEENPNLVDSLYNGENVTLDSLLYSPRTGNEFQYTVNDTGRVDIYLLEDPDSGDRIGSDQPDVTEVNAASWE